VHPQSEGNTTDVLVMFGKLLKGIGDKIGGVKGDEKRKKTSSPPRRENESNGAELAHPFVLNNNDEPEEYPLSYSAVHQRRRGGVIDLHRGSVSDAALAYRSSISSKHDEAIQSWALSTLLVEHGPVQRKDLGRLHLLKIGGVCQYFCAQNVSMGVKCLVKVFDKDSITPSQLVRARTECSILRRYAICGRCTIEGP